MSFGWPVLKVYVAHCLREPQLVRREFLKNVSPSSLASRLTTEVALHARLCQRTPWLLGGADVALDVVQGRHALVVGADQLDQLGAYEATIDRAAKLPQQ